MNWLGEFVSACVQPHETVLDLGCGILSPFDGKRIGRFHLGIDCFKPYLDQIGPPTQCGTLPEVAAQWEAEAFDVVLLLDVLEHLEKPKAIDLIGHALRIARRQVILFTPDGAVPQAGYNAWGLGHNDAQAHRCGFTAEELAAFGFSCVQRETLSPDGAKVIGLLGVKSCAAP